MRRRPPVSTSNPMVVAVSNPQEKANPTRNRCRGRRTFRIGAASRRARNVAFTAAATSTLRPRRSNRRVLINASNENRLNSPIESKNAAATPAPQIASHDTPGLSPSTRLRMVPTPPMTAAHMMVTTSE